MSTSRQARGHVIKPEHRCTASELHADVRSASLAGCHNIYMAAGALSSSRQAGSSSLAS